jgi:hypothetical protein
MAGGGLDPAGIVSDAGIGADGAKDDIGRGRDNGGVFDDVFERRAEIAAAKLEEAEDEGVSIDAVAAGEIEIFGDQVAGFPAKEGFLDEEAFLVLTDFAFAGVALGIRDFPDGGARLEVAANPTATAATFGAWHGRFERGG